MKIFSGLDFLLNIIISFVPKIKTQLYKCFHYYDFKWFTSFLHKIIGCCLYSWAQWIAFVSYYSFSFQCATNLSPYCWQLGPFDFILLFSNKWMKYIATHQFCYTNNIIRGIIRCHRQLQTLQWWPKWWRGADFGVLSLFEFKIFPKILHW